MLTKACADVPCLVSGLTVQRVRDLRTLATRLRVVTVSAVLMKISGLQIVLTMHFAAVTVQVTGAAGSDTGEALFTINGVQQTPVEILPLGDGPQGLILGQNIEWVIERLPGEGNLGGSPSLLNFGTITLMNCAGSTATTAASSFPQDGDLIDMTGADGNGISAKTAITGSADSDNIEITWQMA